MDAIPARMGEPATLGRFEIRERIGQGAFGRVYRAWDPKLRREVALKVVPAGSTGLEEAYTLAQVDHENVVRVFDADSVNGETLIAMQFLRGQTLEKVIQSAGKMPPQTASRIGRDICRGLAVLHQHHLVHRDIKPQNVMVCEDGRPVLMDLGLATDFEGCARRGELVGTLPFMAPELFLGDPATVSTDIYAVGVTLFYALTGAYPVEGRTYEEIRRAHLLGARRRLSAHVARPRQLIAAIERAVEPGPEARFSSVADFMEALEAPSRQRRPIRAGIPLVVILCAAWISWRVLLPSPNYRQSRVTSSAGLDTGAALSGDGRLLVYASDEGGRRSLQLHVRDLSTGLIRRITHTEFEESDPSISPDGKSVVYRSERQGGGVYRCNLDGSGELFLAQGGNNPQFSPDGKSILYWVKQPSTMDVAGRGFRVPASGGPPVPVAPEFRDVRFPVWLPDGRILFQGNASQIGRFTADLFIVRPEGGPPQPTRVFERFRKAGYEPYLGPVRANAKNLVIAAGKTDWVSIWEVAFQPLWLRWFARPQKLTAGTSREILPAVSENGRIAFESLAVRQKIFRAGLDRSPLDRTEPENVTATIDYELLPTVSADGGVLAYRKITDDKAQIWIRNLRDTAVAGSPVTTDSDPLSFPVLDPTGASLAYNKGSGSMHILRDGQTSLLCSRCGRPLQWLSGEKILSLAEDGSGLLYVNARTGESTRWFVPEGGTVVDADVRGAGEVAAVSIQGSSAETTIGLFQINSATPRRIATLSAASAWVDRPRWALDGATLFYLSNRDGNLCIWKQSVEPRSARPVGQPVAVVHLHTAHLSMSRSNRSTLNIAVDRKWLYFSATELQGNIWLLEPGS